MIHNMQHTFRMNYTNQTPISRSQCVTFSLCAMGLKKWNYLRVSFLKLMSPSSVNLTTVKNTSTNLRFF